MSSYFNQYLIVKQIQTSVTLFAVKYIYGCYLEIIQKLYINNTVLNAIGCMIVQTSYVNMPKYS